MNDPRLANDRSPHVSTIRAERHMVRPEAGCPWCGERHTDRLEVRGDGETIRCLTCGAFFPAFSSH